MSSDTERPEVSALFRCLVGNLPLSYFPIADYSSKFLQSRAYEKRILLGRQTGVPCYPKEPVRSWMGHNKDDKNKPMYYRLASTHFFSRSANFHETPNLFDSQ